MKKCKKCKKELKGKMLFYPDLCLSCVIDLHIKKENGKEF
jgi:hypothetical protein